MSDGKEGKEDVDAGPSKSLDAAEIALLKSYVRAAARGVPPSALCRAARARRLRSRHVRHAAPRRALPGAPSFARQGARCWSAGACALA